MCCVDSVQTVLFYYKTYLPKESLSSFYTCLYNTIAEIVVSEGAESIGYLQNFTAFLQTHTISDFSKDSAVYKEIRETSIIQSLTLLLQSLVESPVTHVFKLLDVH